MIKKKICMVGLYGVGKTSLVKRFVESMFDEKYLTTIGVKIDKKDVDVDGTAVSLAIWDLAGEDEMAQVRVSHLRGASGYILVADGTRIASLKKAVELRERIEQVLGALPFVLVVNKADLKEQWEIRESDLEELEDWTRYESSARTGAGVEETFLALSRRMLEQDQSRPADDEDDE